jgi:hypothetical protein
MESASNWQACRARVQRNWINLELRNSGKYHCAMNTPSKPCRNCGRTEFYAREVYTGGFAASLLPIGMKLFDTYFSGKSFCLRVCGDCGLVDWFVPEKHLAKVKEQFPRE